MNNTEGASRKIEVDAESYWPTFDALPGLLRRAIADAPFDYDVYGIADAYRAARNDIWNPMSVGEFIQQMEQNFRLDVMRDSFTKAEKHGTYKLVRRVSARQRIKPHIPPQRKRFAQRYTVF